MLGRKDHMKKVTLKKRIRYWLDERMSKGTASMIKLLLFTVLTVVILVTALVFIFNLDGDGRGIIAVFWDNLRSAMSSSFPASNSGTLMYIVLYTLLGLTGMIFTGMLVGIFSSTMRGKLLALQKENPEIIEEGHTVILGFKRGEYALLSELITAAGTSKRTFVIVENIDREEMEQEIRKNVKIPKNIRVTAIKADTTSPNSMVCCNIADCSKLVINTREKGRTVKTILAVEILLMNAARRPKIVATVDANITIFPKASLKEKGISMLHSGDVVARIIAHAATQTGIYEAFMDIIDFDNYEFYFESIPEASGLMFGNAVLSAKKGIITGIYRSGEVLLNPPRDAIIMQDDLLVVFEENPRDVYLEAPEAVVLPEKKELAPAEPIPEVVIFGINQSISTVLRELPDNIEKVHFIGISKKDKEDFIPDESEFPMEIVADYRNSDYEFMLNNMVKNAQHIIILSDRRKSEEDSDTDTMLRIIRLRDIKKKYNLPFTITAEIRCEKNRKLITTESSEDFVVATDLSSMMLAQITEDIRRAGLFNDILDEEGSEVYLKKASDVGLENGEITFEDLRNACYAYGYILMGLREKNGDFRILSSDSIFTVGPEDRLIVIGEE